METGDWRNLSLTRQLYRISSVNKSNIHDLWNEINKGKGNSKDQLQIHNWITAPAGDQLKTSWELIKEEPFYWSVLEPNITINNLESFWVHSINVRGMLMQPSENVLQMFSKGSHTTNVRKTLHEAKYAAKHCCSIHVYQKKIIIIITFSDRWGSAGISRLSRVILALK